MSVCACSTLIMMALAGVPVKRAMASWVTAAVAAMLMTPALSTCPDPWSNYGFANGSPDFVLQAKRINEVRSAIQWRAMPQAMLTADKRACACAQRQQYSFQSWLELPP